MTSIFAEIRANKGIKSKIVVISFRVSQWGDINLIRKIITLPVYWFYKIVVDFFWGVEIPISCKIGPGLTISHAKNITIHPNVTCGSNLHLRHSVTLGNKSSNSSDAPRLGNNIEFGCNSSVLGSVFIGNNVIIGAHCLVLSDIPENSIVTGIPGKLKL